jgi:hypothetical protein
MSNQLAISKQIEEIHQQVREFVEKTYPEYKVICVNNFSETQYDRDIRQTMPEFRVYGINVEHTKEFSCDVIVTSEGEMGIKSMTQSGKKTFLSSF